MRQALLGNNAGLFSLRALVEARISFAGNQIALPGVLLLQGEGGFRLDLLDPLDRPVVIIFPEDRGIVQYRPSLESAAVLSPFPGGCRGAEASAWVAPALSVAAVPGDGEEVRARSLFGRRYLEIWTGGELRQSVQYREEGGEIRPTLVTWYCDEEPVLQLKVREWQLAGAWRLPQRIEVLYVKAGLELRLDLKETEANPPPGDGPLRPHLGAETRWSVWNLPR